MRGKKEKFVKRLHEIDERFSTALAWEDNYKTRTTTLLMTPATEFYRIYKQEINDMQQENERLKKLLKEISKLSDPNQ